MNPVDTQVSQLLQVFGATSTQSVAALFGTQNAANDIQQDFATQFRGFLQGTEGVKSSDIDGLIDLSNTAVQAVSAAPEDYALALKPTDLTQQPVSLETLFAGKEAITLVNQTNGEEVNLTPEQFGALNLAVDYRAIQPLELTAENLQALQTTLPKGLVELPVAAAIQTPAPVPFSPVEVNAGTQATHLLPSKELLALLGENTDLSSSLVSGENIVTKDQVTSGAPAATATATAPNAATVATTPAQTPAGSTVPADQVTASNSSLPSGDTKLENNILQSSFRDLQKTAETNNSAAQAVVTDDKDADDIEGQLLAVAQKPKNKANALLQTPNAATTAQASETPQAAAIAAPATRPAATDTKRPIEADKHAGLKAEAPTPVTAKAEAPVITPPARPTALPTPAWTTPESAAGWSDGAAGSLISSGLSSLTGQNSPFGGLGLMGGRPDPLLGQQVAKQLNVNITRAVKAGDNQFSIRLDPAELGRVTVKMTFTQDGLIKSQIMAERPETLELLQRDARDLERALESGGHKAEPGSISFSLDDSGQESAGKAFAEALQEDRLKEEQQKNVAALGEAEGLTDEIEEEIDLDEILAHVTPETGLDVRV